MKHEDDLPKNWGRYPHLHAPRPLPPVIGATSDARWRNVPKKVWTVDRLRVHEMQQRARKPQAVKATREGPIE